MNRYLFLLILLIGGYQADAQCLTSSLVINTGYNPITGTSIPPGIDGGTPVPDPKWKVTAVSPGVTAAAGGLIVVAPGGQADVITRWSGWAMVPVGTPAGYLGCLNSAVYTTDGTGPTGTIYSATFSRQFRLCTADSVTLDVYIANDNYIAATDIDGVPLLFSQPATPAVGHYSVFTHFVQTVYLPAGIHNFNVVQHNYNVIGASANPVGMAIYGTLASATATNSLVSETFATCDSFTCTNVCNAIDLVDSLHPCAGDVVTLPATLIGTDSVLSITWSPVTGLSSSTILAPSLTVGATSSYYYITVRSLIPYNLVTNGDFSAGNTGFSSSYTYAPGPSGVLLEGNYSVFNNPFSVHSGFTSFGDHTTGTGSMMIINGGPTPTDVWCQTVPVTPNTDYDFSAWIANCSSVTVGPDVPILQFRINGVLIGTPTTITSAPGVWTNFFSVWNSGISTTANICISDLNTTPAGNDFVLDDISFREVCTAVDSVYIDVVTTDTTTSSSDTTLCAVSGPISLSGAPGFTSYVWSTGATTATIVAPITGVYWVRGINNCSVRIDTFDVTYVPVPVVNLGPDTSFCIGNTLILSSTQPAGSSFRWNTGSTGNTIAVTASGTYWLRVDNGYCTFTDTIHVVVSPFPVVDLGADTVNCIPSSVTLQSSVTYTGAAYLWNNASTGSSLVAATTGSYWLRVTIGGCASTDSINVTILYDTFTLFNKDTSICRGQAVPTFLNLNPSATIQWLPTAGIASPNIATPVIIPDTSDMYYVHIYLAGCPDLVDSFYIDVQPNPLVFMAGNRQVCEFDTLHLHARVNPAWYTNYSYSWTPGTYLDDSTMSTVVFLAGDSMKIFVRVTTPAGCSGIDSGLLFVYPGNFARLDTNISLCPHDSAQLIPVEVIPTGAISYVWHPGLYLEDSTATSPWVYPVASRAYMAVATSQYGCRDTITANVVVRAGAVLTLGDSVVIHPGESYQISPKTNCVSFTWFPAAGLDNPYVSNPIATPQISTKYKVSGQTEWGCKVTDSISIYFDANSLLALPNAFVPGGNINSKLLLLRRGAATLNYFRIFNRWGNLVFETTDINEGWDGSYKGKPQPFGVYVYDIEATDNGGNVFQKHGNVTLIR